MIFDTNVLASILVSNIISKYIKMYDGMLIPYSNSGLRPGIDYF